MKVRLDFVSNSSSCGFIVIQTTKRAAYNFNNQDVLLPSYNGRHEFGWENRRYSDIWSKLNFCALQLIELKAIEDSFDPNAKHRPYITDREYFYRGRYRRYYDLFKEVCQTEFHLDIELRDRETFRYGRGEIYAYIDHGSCVTENKNMGMFESRQALVDFLTSSDSYIQMGNDNGE